MSSYIYPLLKRHLYPAEAYAAIPKHPPPRWSARKDGHVILSTVVVNDLMQFAKSCPWAVKRQPQNKYPRKKYETGERKMNTYSLAPHRYFVQNVAKTSRSQVKPKQQGEHDSTKNAPTPRLHVPDYPIDVLPPMVALS